MSNDDKEFKRQNSHKFKRVPDSWRRPRGKHSNIRLKKKYAPKMPSVGYRAPESIRGLHPSGYEDVLVHTPADLDELDSAEHAVRIASSVGGRKRAAIAEKARDMGLKLLNYAEEEDTSDSDDADEADE